MILSVCPNPSIDCYAWAQNIVPGTVNRIEKLQEFPGGKGIHVALAIRELGVGSRIFANWAGPTGEWIKEACLKKNLEISGIHINGINRKCYTFRSSNTELSNTEILEPGPEFSLQFWEEFKKVYSKEILHANLLCLAGSWPKGAPKNAYFQLIEIATEKKKNVFLDCTGEQLEEALKSSFFGLHLNQNEAFNFCGSENFRDLLKKLKGKISLVAMTRGKEGLWMFYEGKIYHANVKIDEVLSTVGSGDCLTAGIAWAYEQGFPPEDMAAYGVACGAANCLNEELGMLRKDDVAALFPKVKLKILENEL